MARKADGDGASGPAPAPASEAVLAGAVLAALAAGSVALAGTVLPLRFGLALPIGVLALAAALALRRARLVAEAARGGTLTERFAALEPLSRAAIVACTIVPAVALATVAARGVGALVIAFPAALWALAASIVAAAIVPRIAHARARTLVLVALAAALPQLGVLGTRWEADGEDARGWAWSGPIHGIHPFQTTSIVVDGHGPFDLPINDYVEPDGSRGYGPDALADAIELALHRIAEVHFADGPARARMAFALAEAGAERTPPVYERLDREPAEPDHPRFWVRSGTTGQRSKVEFVCPGRRDDPRGDPGESVMNRMCPDKYASEASAGLGVTGRWPGYAEGRGNERAGLSKLFGWTRSDDAIGRERVEDEQRWCAWIALLIAAASVALARGRDRPRWSDGATAIAGALAGVGVAVACWLVLAAGPTAPRVAAMESAPAWVDAWALAPWLPAIALLAGLPLVVLASPRSSARDVASAHTWIAAAFVPVAVATLAAAAHLGLGPGLAPDLAGGHGELALERLVMAMADRVHAPLGLDPLEAEGVVASALAIVLVGLLVALARTVVVAGTLARAPRDAPGSLALVVWLAVAAALVVSRKTLGAATLVPGAFGIAIVLGSGLSIVAQPDRPRVRDIVEHVGSVALAVALVWSGAQSAPEPQHPFVWLTTLAGLAAAILGATLLRPKPRGAGP